MAQTYDVIIIGSGPNGLAIAAYLSKAGQKVLLLEKRHEAGGGLATEQVTIPDFYHNTHAVYMMMADYAPVYEDFGFEARGVTHIYPELQVAMSLADGRALSIYRDVERTCASIATFSKKDAESYREMQRHDDELMKNILAPQTYVPMEAAPLMAAKAEMTELGRALAEYTDKTPEEIVCERYENEHVRTLMLYMACHWGLDYAQSGVSYTGADLSQPHEQLSPHGGWLAPRGERVAEVDLRARGADQNHRPNPADHRRARGRHGRRAGRRYAVHGEQGRGEHHRHASDVPQVRR